MSTGTALNFQHYSEYVLTVLNSLVYLIKQKLNR